MATGAILVVAQRKTVWPSWMKWPLRPSIRIASRFFSSLPQITGPMPGSSEALTTAAPAPSAKMIAVARSSGFVQSVSRSEPTTSTFLDAPVRTAWSAVAMP